MSACQSSTALGHRIEKAVGHGLDEVGRDRHRDGGLFDAANAVSVEGRRDLGWAEAERDATLHRTRLA